MSHMISIEYVFSELQSLICSLNNSFSILQQVVMTIAILLYAVEHYNSLLELRMTKDQFEFERVLKILFSKIERVLSSDFVRFTSEVLSLIVLSRRVLSSDFVKFNLEEYFL